MANARNHKVIAYKQIIEDGYVLSCSKATYAHNGTRLYECAKIINEHSLDFIQLKGDLVLIVLPENLRCDLFDTVAICTLGAKIEVGLMIEMNHSKGSTYAYSLEVSRVVELEGYSYLELKSMGSCVTVVEYENRRYADSRADFLARGFKMDAEYERRRREKLDLLGK